MARGWATPPLPPTLARHLGRDPTPGPRHGAAADLTQQTAARSLSAPPRFPHLHNGDANRARRTRAIKEG